MKKLFLCLVAILASAQFLKSQVTYTATFNDGKEKSVTFDYDDPYSISRFRMGVGFFGMDVPHDAVMSFILHPEFQVNSRLQLEGIFRFAYSRNADGNIPEQEPDNDRFKSFNNLRLIAHYDIFHGIKTKKKKVPIDWAYDGNGTTVYVIEVPRKFLNSVSFDFGFQTNRVASDLEIGLKNPVNPASNVNNVNYYLDNHRSVSIQTGFSHFKSQSYKMTTNGTHRSYFRTRRIYANIIYGFVNKGEYYKKVYSTTSELVESDVADESILELPEKKSLGWVVGYSKHLGIKNSGMSMWYGIELGGLPFLANEGYKDDVRLATPSTIFSMHFGLAFGPRPRK